MTAMFADLTHPSHDQLRSFVMNRLDDVDTALIRNHLRICADCQGQWQRMTSVVDPVSDTFTGATDTTNTGSRPMLTLDAKTTLVDLPLVLTNHPRFSIISILGSGAMGTVYRAVDQSS